MKRFKNANGNALLNGVIIIIVILLALAIAIRVSSGNKLNTAKLPDLAKVKEVVSTIIKNVKSDVQKTEQQKQDEKNYGGIPDLEFSETEFVEYTEEHKIEVIATKSSEKIKYLGESEIKEAEEGTALIKYKGKMYVVDYKKQTTSDNTKTNKLKLVEEVNSKPELYAAIAEGSKVYEKSQDNGTINYESFEYNNKIYTKIVSINKNKIFEKETVTVFEDYPDIYYTEN